MLYSRSSKSINRSYSTLNHHTQFYQNYRPHPKTYDSRKSSHGQTELRTPIPFLDEIKQCQDSDEALSLFYQYQRTGFKHDYPSYSSLIYKLARARNFEAVETLLNSLKQYSIRCKETLFMALFEHYCKAKLSDKAIELFRSMTSFNCVRSLQSFNTILNALVDNDCLAVADEMLRGSSKMGFRWNSVTYNIVIKMWLQKSEWDRAQELFDEMLDREVEPTVVTYNSLIGFLCERNELDKAKGLFQDMVKKGKRPNAVTYALLMEGLCSLGKFKEAKKLMFDMDYRGCTSGLVNYGVLMTDLGKRGEFDEAKRLLVEMKKRGIKPDVVMFNILINYFCKEGRVAEAYKLLVDMQVGGCKPNAATYRTMVDGFCRAGEFEDGLKVLNAMLMSGHFPRAETFFCLFLGLVKTGSLDSACFVLEEMEKRKIRFDLNSWEGLVADTCREDKSVNEFITGLIASS